MVPARRPFPFKKIALLGGLEILLLTGLWWMTLRRMDRMNQAVNDLSELSDPSPFRAALMGHLGKIHLGLEAYFKSSDPALLDQASQSRRELETSLPEFKKQSPRLFTPDAMEEIGKSFVAFKEAVDHALDANARRFEHRGKIEKNFAQILSHIYRDIRPLIRDAQPDGQERKEAILQVENQARAWQQNILKVWT